MVARGGERPLRADAQRNRDRNAEQGRDVTFDAIATSRLVLFGRTGPLGREE